MRAVLGKHMTQMLSEMLRIGFILENEGGPCTDGSEITRNEDRRRQRQNVNFTPAQNNANALFFNGNVKLLDYIKECGMAIRPSIHDPPRSEKPGKNPRALV